MNPRRQLDSPTLYQMSYAVIDKYVCVNSRSIETRVESMKLLPRRPVARGVVFGVVDAENNATRDRPARQQLH